MDLEDRGLKSLSRRFINAYLELTGDYRGLTLLPFYKAYRAMVRAKISLFRLAQEQDPVERVVILRQYRNYAALAESYSAIPSRFLAITHGVSAVGKSHVAMRLVEAFGAIRLRSDVERKRLLPTAGEAELYSSAATLATYSHLHQQAAAILQAGFPVVLDATYLKQAQRQAAHTVAEQTGAPFLILDCHAPQAVIAAWLAERQAEGQDPSDATLNVIRAQEAGREPLSEAEQTHSGRIATHETASLDNLIERIRSHLPGF
jgi:predicted kinase